MSWEVDQAVTQAKDDGKRMEARLQELGEEANNLEDALSETEADRDRLAAELHAVRDELATAHEEIILSRQSEGDTMADLLATREERDKLRAELDRLRSAPVAVEVPGPTVQQWLHEVLDPAEADPDPHATMRHATRWFREHIRTIPSDRVLNDGEVVASKDDLALLLQDACRYSGGADDAWDPDEVVRRLRVVRERNALRSNGGE